jgi:hypothetical protein
MTTTSTEYDETYDETYYEIGLEESETVYTLTYYNIYMTADNVDGTGMIYVMWKDNLLVRSPNLP